MLIFCYLVLSFFFVINSIKCNTNISSPKSIPSLLIISYDGFRNEYFKRNVTNYLNKLKKSGTYADYMINVFPTKTFPNHHSISSGVQTDKHGVTSNVVNDKKFGVLRYGYELFHYNEDIIPIWILNQLSGSNRYSGCIMWPGSNFSYKNQSCTFIQNFNKSITFDKRVDTAMNWLTHPKTPANLVLLYIEEPDSHGHGFGPNSIEVTNVIAKLDNLTQYIQYKLKEKKLDQTVNVIHLSDHGMEAISEKNYIDLTKILNETLFSFYGTSPVLQIVPKNGNDKIVYNILKKESNNQKSFNVYWNEELPKEWNYRVDQRTGPITVVANVGFGFQDLIITGKYYEKEFNATFLPNHEYGIHGYDTKLPTMHPFFMAKGPQIKEHHKIKPFNTIDLYQLFCKILQIIPPKNIDGNLENVIDILKVTENNKNKKSTPLFIALGSAMIVFSATMFVTVLMLYLVKRRKQNKVNHSIIKDVMNEFSLEEQESLMENIEI